MEIKIQMLGKKRVATEINGFRVETDQPLEDGGEGRAPSPFDLFLASIGTCAGFYVQSFCQVRGIATEGIELTQCVRTDEKSHLVSAIQLSIFLPKEFPEKYRPGLLAAVNSCTVKKHLLHPPVVEVMMRAGS
jgi:putative redox protein